MSSFCIPSLTSVAMVGLPRQYFTVPHPFHVECICSSGMALESGGIQWNGTGIRRNSRIPAESTGMDRNSGGIRRNGLEFQRNLQEWTGRNSCYFPNIGTFGGPYIFISYLYLPNLI